MKEKIEFKKSIIFKTTIAEITDINITHDYKIKDDTVDGTFTLSGLYKMTSASVKEEEFFYNIPFVIALSDRIKKESINLNLYDFEYTILKDTLNTKMTLEMEYEETESLEIDKTINEMLETDYEETEEPEKTNDEIEEKIVNEEEIKQDITENNINNLTSAINMENNYVTYKVHITRENDTFESIASKYDVSIDDIKLYNDNEVLSIGDKLVIPYHE